jgi:[CysO sulfur-carrier protein]-S-L-cysteine hydrolase
VITLVQRALDDVRAHARDEAPRECCGVLIGRDRAILESARALNLAEGTSRFLIDPRDHIRAMRDARTRQMDVIGFYHSHPRSQAVPSETDVAESGYAGAMHLIVGVAPDGSPEARLFVIDGGGVKELEFVLVETSG